MISLYFSVITICFTLGVGFTYLFYICEKPLLKIIFLGVAASQFIFVAINILSLFKNYIL